ncbi:BTAD domain-containing putative transcriptional regulator [Streptomyces sp. NPDC047071]|uniref:BTAD domain-containing putative transcriptional regulator n=1 Tax=Streptomyces sp. NPDC047071 TaxID=3154808 RepID=UPI0034544B51
MNGGTRLRVTTGSPVRAVSGTRLRVTLLGAFQVCRGDAVLPVPGARSRALVARLALAGGDAVGASGLIDAIWAEDPPSGPGHALQALVSRLRRTLGSAGAVTRLAGGYHLAVDAADVDALRFEQLAAAGRDRLRAGDLPGAAGLLGEAVALWGDRPGTEPAAVAAVAPAVAVRLAHASVEAVTDLADAELALGRADAAAARLAALLAEHPVHERAAALLMDALAAQGRQADALALYERVRESLADALGAEPGAALSARQLSLLRAERPAPDTTRIRSGNLPAPLTSFIGRDDDLARIDALLAAGRLVTVVGPGGAGKTRLAVEAARRHRHAHPDGVWLIDLAAVTEPAKVGAALLAAIGLRGSALFAAPAGPRGHRVDELDALVDQLDGRESLLVVDNCEHLIDAVAQLVTALLTRCAALRVLATSRAPLAVDGEALVPLGPLALPGPHAEAEQARRAPSVRLFTERAAAVRPGFAVHEDNLDDVLRVVRGLDGLPLALELAAARLRTLSLTGLAAGLSDRFRLLTTGSRTALPRHRTLRAVIAWSWDLLGPDARAVAERVSVLPGGVTPASAAAVCAGAPVPAAEVPELLAALVDRSLLHLAPDTGRYRMLETLREYGQERLAEQGVLTGVRDLAARHFAAWTAHQDPLLRGPVQLDALHELHAEYANVLAALRHLCATGDAAGALTLALDLSWYWQMLGRHADAAYWLAEAVALPVRRPNVRRDVAEGLLVLNTLVPRGGERVGHWPEERREELRALVGRLLSRPELLSRPDLPGLCGVLTVVGLAPLVGTEVPATVLAELTAAPDAWTAGMARLLRAHLAENDGRFEEVGGDVRAALECFTRAGDRWGLARALPLHALTRQYDGDLDGAVADLNEAKRLAGAFGSLSLTDEVYVDLRLIDLYVRLDEAGRAAETIAAARERVLRSALPGTAVLLDAWEAALSMGTGALPRARDLVESIDAARTERALFGGDHGQAVLGALRGALCLALGDGPGAEEALGRAYAMAVSSRDMPVVAIVAVTVAGLAVLRGRFDEAAVLLGAAARLRGAHDPTDPQVGAVSGRGRAELGAERFAEAYERGWRLDRTAALARVDPARVSRDG